MIASKVGGIQDQITDGEEGLLLADPTDLRGLGALLAELLAAPDQAQRLGKAAKEKVVGEFLGDRHLRQYADMITQLVREHAAT